MSCMWSGNPVAYLAAPTPVRRRFFFLRGKIIETMMIVGSVRCNLPMAQIRFPSSGCFSGLALEAAQSERHSVCLEVFVSRLESAPDLVFALKCQLSTTWIEPWGFCPGSEEDLALHVEQSYRRAPSLPTRDQREPVLVLD